MDRLAAPWNESGFTNAEFDRLSSKVEGNLDVDGHREVMAEIERIVQEGEPITQPFRRSVITAYDKRVTGLRARSANYILANELAIENQSFLITRPPSLSVGAGSYRDHYKLVPLKARPHATRQASVAVAR